MKGNSQTGGGGGVMPWRLAGWGAVALVLLAPIAADFPWTSSDFIAMAVLLGGAGIVVELAVRASGSLFYRAAAGFAVAAALLLVWVNGAVGFLGDEDNPANLIFFVVIAIAVLGSVIAGFNPAGMARAMFATAAGQVLAGVIGLAAGFASPGYSGLYEVVMGTSFFASLWLLSAALFRKAAGGATREAGRR